ncbi:GntR family transcriptional regulator [Streptomyces spiroverticillatus]|uniref:GntR family transcriptional regulator n=1 Tax=Streptomyces finlayi TaxID=67296 RepID=A0A918WWM7_9ACTN|nr:FadR/GntR family transcriptional regulator [Streptomyces finlayi]GHA05521.1 GntR family transcriptional regulator [Streptomyces spiroverticillatus]GHC89382.1 GntR family transcriptional regulator [Streptomyces finlayi]
MPSAADAIEQIKHMIVQTEVQPGDRLPTERELAARFGMSRSTVREAVRALTTMNVLESRVGAGTYVTDLRPGGLLDGTAFALDLMRSRNILQLLEIRRTLDALAASQAAVRITPEGLAGLRELIAVMESDADLDERIGADLEFHRVVARASGNEVLAALLESVSGDTTAARRWRGAVDGSAAERMSSEHHLILSALELGDPHLASVAAAAHVGGVETWLRSLDVDRLPAGDADAAPETTPSPRTE